MTEIGTPQMRVSKRSVAIARPYVRSGGLFDFRFGIGLDPETRPWAPAALDLVLYSTPLDRAGLGRLSRRGRQG